MAEFVEKSELEKCMTEDWVLENLAAQDSKSSIKKDIENVIDNLPTTTEAELRESVIDEFTEAIMVKATELSEKVVFDGRLVGYALSLDCVSDMALEIALRMKGEKECQAR